MSENERDTPAPEPITKDLRKYQYLLAAVEPAMADMLEHGADGRGQQGVWARHLGLAWEDGARKQTDLETALGVLRSHVDALQADRLVMLHTIEQLAAEMAALRSELDVLKKAHEPQ